MNTSFSGTIIALRGESSIRNWGVWGTLEFCPAGQVATSFNTAAELVNESEGFGICGIRLRCTSGDTITSMVHPNRGVWQPADTVVCPGGYSEARLTYQTYRVCK